MARWVALFSQTGTEIVELSKAVGRWPDRIFTNNKNIESINPELKNRYVVLSHNGIEEQLGYESEIRDTMVTLHGYLRILSPLVCELPLDIYNGHPAPIDIYPELKGKDPQEKIWGGKYEYTGAVVHRVISELDSGKIVSAIHGKNVAQSKEELYNITRAASMKAWTLFLKGKL